MDQGGHLGPEGLVRVLTADGARVTVKRKPTPGGRPVIFLHGLAVNADLWDLPEIRGDKFHYRSLASVLHEAAYDIWLVNLRGHGAPHMLSDPAPGQKDWCIDHFILYDLPAVVDHVLRETGRRPFVVGASMGAMTLAGYVQGATLTADGDEAHIVAEPALAEQRAAQLAGAVFVEFPAAMRWPESPFDERGQLDLKKILQDSRKHDAARNYPFELLARWGWLNALVEAAGQVPLGWLRPEAGEPWWKKLPRPLADRVAGLERNVVQAMLALAGTFTGAANHRAEVILQGRRYVMDHMKAGVLKQLAKSVRQGSFVSALGSPDHAYSDHYHLVAVPTLVIMGGRDRIANATVTRELFFERIAASDKAFRLYDDLAHGEFEASPAGCDLVYPDIKSWIADRDKDDSKI